MNHSSTLKHGGQILANALVRQGVEFAFGVPGESFLPLLDGLVDHNSKLRFITCRQEGGASYMAEAYAKLTGKPGVLMVTRGAKWAVSEDGPRIKKLGYSGRALPPSLA